MSTPGTPPTSEPLPCPFCGHLPEAHTNGTVYCRTMGCPVENRQAFLDKWNRRALLDPPRPLSIDNVLFQLEGAMDACCDQPLHADRMTLTRTWRDILEEFASVPSVTEADDTDGMLWVQMPRGSLEASLEDAKRILARGTWKGDAIDQVLWQGHVDRLTAALYPSIDFRATGDAVRTAPTEEKRND